MTKLGIFPYSILKERYNFKKIQELAINKEFIPYLENNLKIVEQYTFATRLEKMLLIALLSLENVCKASNSKLASSEVKIINMCKDLLGHIKSINGSKYAYKYDITQRKKVNEIIISTANKLVDYNILNKGE